MTRQSISLTYQNDEWLKNQVEEEEFSSKSEAINHLIRQARTQEQYFEFVRNKIELAEQRGMSNKSKEEILAEIKKNVLHG